LQKPLQCIPDQLEQYRLELAPDGSMLTYTFDAQHEQTGIADLLRKLGEHGIDFKDLQSSQSSLEDIFVSLVSKRP
jgi:ABC-2 type transport system ATP-binding protein